MRDYHTAASEFAPLIAASVSERTLPRVDLIFAHAGMDRALIDATVQGIADIRASAEGREGVSSFLQKRKPGWLLP